MNKIKLKWTLNEAKDFALIFSSIISKDIKELRQDANLYLCAVVLLGFQKNLSDKILTAKMLFQPEIRITLKTEQALAIVALIEGGYFESIAKPDTHGESIMILLYGIIHQKFMI